jgi:hypothetical protein
MHDVGGPGPTGRAVAVNDPRKSVTAQPAHRYNDSAVRHARAPIPPTRRAAAWRETRNHPVTDPWMALLLEHLRDRAEKRLPALRKRVRRILRKDFGPRAVIPEDEFNQKVDEKLLEALKKSVRQNLAAAISDAYRECLFAHLTTMEIHGKKATSARVDAELQLHRASRSRRKRHMTLPDPADFFVTVVTMEINLRSVQQFPPGGKGEIKTFQDVVDRGGRRTVEMLRLRHFATEEDLEEKRGPKMAPEELLCARLLRKHISRHGFSERARQETAADLLKLRQGESPVPLEQVRAVEREWAWPYALFHYARPDWRILGEK